MAAVGALAAVGGNRLAGADRAGVTLNDPGLLRREAWIDGQWQGTTTRATIPVIDPASGEVIARLPEFGAESVDRAVTAADRAGRAWAARPARERADRLRCWHDLILEHIEDLALLVTSEQGKPLAEARREVGHAAAYIAWFAEEARRVCGDTLPLPQADRRGLVIRQPVGVVAAITPWNFPCALVARKVAPALAAGCSVVVKPATETPLSALALAELARRAGFPPGVLNVVPGRDARAIGQALAEDPRVRMLSFTGSTDVGRWLLARCAGTVKRTAMELGGNAPFLVFADADLDRAVAGALASRFRNSGQTCVSANRFLVHESLHDVFAARLAAAVRGLVVGDGRDGATTQGPLIHAAAVARVDALVLEAVARGARVVVGGRPADHSGHFYLPTVLVDIDPAMRLFREEVFGPVASISRFSTEDEAVALANDSEHGLAAYLYTRDIGRAWRVGEALEAGMVGINEATLSSEAVPFGGIKASGHGREGSKHGLEDYLEMKYLCMGGLAGKASD